jgi:hypothetical protein
MAFFEELGKKVSQTGQGAIKKTKIMAETSKLNSQISAERRTIAENHSKIGERYCELFSDNPDGNFAPFVAAVKESCRKINEYEDQINMLKGIETCPNCGAELKEKALFCPSCGGKLPEPPEAQEPAPPVQRACANCGSPLLDGVRFCGTCGARNETA